MINSLGGDRTALPFPVYRDGAETKVTDTRADIRCRTVFLSDTHVGSRGCKATELRAFLGRLECGTLYLVGDIIDVWALRRKWYWPRSHSQVVRKLFAMARNGTRVIFIPGNHDEVFRCLGGLRIRGVEIRREHIYRCRDGRRMLVCHGDEYDPVQKHTPWLSSLGGLLYEWLLRLSVVIMKLMRLAGLRERSLSAWLKRWIKRVVSGARSYPERLAAEARRRKLNGVICGHTHRPEMRMIDGLLYCNDGDWVESLSALCETHAGELMLIDGKDWTDEWPGPTEFRKAA